MNMKKAGLWILIGLLLLVNGFFIITNLQHKEPTIVVSNDRSVKYDLEVQKATPKLYLNGASGYVKWYENLLLTGGTGKLTLSGGNLDVGANSLLTTGSIAATGSRVTKGWFTNLEISNPPTVNGVPIGSSSVPLDNPIFTTRITTPSLVLGSTTVISTGTELNLFHDLLAPVNLGDYALLKTDTTLFITPYYFATHAVETITSIQRLSSNPTDGSNIYIHTGDRRIRWLEGGVWHRIKATSIDSTTASSNEQNLLLYSEQIDNAGGWITAGTLTRTTDQAVDMLGNTTLELITQTAGTWGYIQQSSIPVIASTNYTIYFDGGWGSQHTGYSFDLLDQSNADAGLYSIDFDGSISGTVSRYSYNFSTPGGCTLLKLRIALAATGDNIYLGRVQIAEPGKTYVTTTNTIVP